MGSLDFKAPLEREKEDADVVAYNTRRGMQMFIVYVLFYGGFMAVSSFWPQVMSLPVIGGVNLAIVSGFALIVLALILALMYMKICRKSAK